MWEKDIKRSPQTDIKNLLTSTLVNKYKYIFNYQVLSQSKHASKYAEEVKFGTVE